MVLRKPILHKPVAKPAAAPATTGGLRRAAPSAPANIAVSNRAVADDPFARSRALKAQQDKEIEARKNRPINFSMKPGEETVNKVTGKLEPGVTVVIVDNASLTASPQRMPHFHYMHHWGYKEGVKGSSKDEVCIQDDPNGCALCGHLGRKGGWEMFLTVIDARPFTPQNGPNAGKVVPRSQKLMECKAGSIGKLERLFKEHGTFRGMMIRCFRDGAKEPGIGSEFRFIKMLSERELATFGDLAKPVDYNKAFPRPTNEELISRWDIDAAAVGSSASSGAAGAEDLSDEIPF